MAGVVYVSIAYKQRNITADTHKACTLAKVLELKLVRLLLLRAKHCIFKLPLFLFGSSKLCTKTIKTNLSHFQNSHILLLKKHWLIGLSTWQFPKYHYFNI